MANRHLSRSIAIQSLFEWDFHGCNKKQIKEIVRHNIAEFAPGLEDDTFILQLVNGVLEKKETLDKIIVKAAPQWPLAQIAAVDRNILRLGLFELLYADKREVSGRVAINEAIELAKTFGGESSGSFVNGVLGAVYREMGEPDKDEVPNKKRRVKDLPPDKLPTEQLVGAVVSGKVEGVPSIALVHDIFGYWTLPKGHLEEGENLEDGVLRKVKAETGLTVSVVEKLGENGYVSADPEKGKIRKEVIYFLTEVKEPEELRLGKSSGLDDARWWALSSITDLKMYDDVVPLIIKAIKKLTKQK